MAPPLLRYASLHCRERLPSVDPYPQKIERIMILIHCELIDYRYVLKAMSKSKIKKCNHEFDGGRCSECGIKMLCVLCGKNPWESRCNVCDKGYICSGCYKRCDECDQNYCKVCDECDCDQWS